MYEESKNFLKVYSAIAILIVASRMFFNRKTTSVDVAALVPAFILICNM